MENQTEINVNQKREQVNKELEELKAQKIISETEFVKVSERLNLDFEFYLKHQDIDYAGVEKMFFETLESFKNFKIAWPLYRIIVYSAYQTFMSDKRWNFLTERKEMIDDGNKKLALQNAMRIWFENYQSEKDKLNDHIILTERIKSLNSHKCISIEEYDEMIATLSKIKNDTSISNEEVKIMLTNGMNKHAKKEKYANLEVFNIYCTVNYIKKLGVEKELEVIFQSKLEKPKELSYAEMKNKVIEDFSTSLNDKMITQAEYDLITETIIGNIEFCENNTVKKEIKKQLLIGLKNLQDKICETEEREAIVDWYFLLSENNKININKNLEKWLYF